MEGLALYAALVATGNLAWTIWHAVRSERFDIRVTAGPEAVSVASNAYELTVAARNFGKTDEAVERMGIRFYDPTATELAESTVSQLVSKELPPNRSAHFRLDLANQRYKVGREYQGFAVLGSGRTVESEWRELEGYSLDLAGIRQVVVNARQGPNLPPPSGPPPPAWR